MLISIYSKFLTAGQIQASFSNLEEKYKKEQLSCVKLRTSYNLVKLLFTLIDLQNPWDKKKYVVIVSEVVIVMLS